MSKAKITKIKEGEPVTRSADVVSENVEQLKALFPEAFTEGRIDFDVLKQVLGGEIDEREEKYGLNWYGKRKARQAALTPSTGTLRPCPEESVDWETTKNIFIEGDNLEVLKLLQKSYAGKVKLIYIDPPYNTGGDFVYPDDYKDGIRNYQALTGQVDEGGRKLLANSESDGRFHTNWLNMMYPRLRLAKSLLRDDGLAIVSIDDSEITNLRLVMDEIFGAERFVECLVWKNKLNAGALTRGFSNVHEYLLVYSKGELGNIQSPLTDEAAQGYNGRDEKFSQRGGFVTQPLATKSKDPRPNLVFPITWNGKRIMPDKQWLWSRERVEAAQANGELVFNESDGKVNVRVKQYMREPDGRVRRMKPVSILIGPYNQAGSAEIDALLGPGVFDYPKPLGLLQYLLGLTTHEQAEVAELQPEIVLDFFAGSGTMGHACLAQTAHDGRTRRSISVQLPQQTEREKFPTIAEITKERLRRAAAQVRDANPLFKGDTGFRVFKLDSSNIRAWEASKEEVANSVEANQEHLQLHRTDDDILYEVLLKTGLDLCVPIETKKIAGKKVHCIGAGTLFVCLEKSIKAADVEKLGNGLVAWKKDLAPAGETTVIFRDSAFGGDDVAKTNLASILEQNDIKNVRSL